MFTTGCPKINHTKNWLAQSCASRPTIEKLDKLRKPFLRDRDFLGQILEKLEKIFFKNQILDSSQNLKYNIYVKGGKYLMIYVIISKAPGNGEILDVHCACTSKEMAAGLCMLYEDEDPFSYIYEWRPVQMIEQEEE